MSDNLVVMLLRFVSGILQKEGKEESMISGIFMDRALPISIKIDFGLVFPNSPVGKVSIRHSSDGEPGLYLCEVPDDIHNGTVVLFDAKCYSGAAAVMAIRVILDHNVLEEKIVFCSLVCSRASAILIHNLFPKVVIVTCRMEEKIKTNEYPILSDPNDASTDLYFLK
jgi:uracil phosphoribosyltransferase